MMPSAGHTFKCVIVNTSVVLEFDYTVDYGNGTTQSMEMDVWAGRLSFFYYMKEAADEDRRFRCRAPQSSVLS